MCIQALLLRILVGVNTDALNLIAGQRWVAQEALILLREALKDRVC